MTDSPFHTHDLIVLVGGAALVAIGVAIGGSAGTASYAMFERDGLSVPYPQNARWFPPTATASPAIDPTGEDPRPAGTAVGVPTPRARLSAIISSVQCSSDASAACADQPTARIAVQV